MSPSQAAVADGAAASRALLVLGMHRSGTSAVAGALARCGVALGERLIEGAADNPGGYFEHADAVLADERLMVALGRAWDDVRPLPAGWHASSAADEAAAALAATVVEPLRMHPTWAVKDPRMSRLLPLWRRVLDAAAVEALGLLVLRHPNEVAASLARRDGMHPRTAHLLWLRHTLEAARHAPTRCAVITYDAFLDEPDHCLAQVADVLGIALAPDALAGFVDRTARHHRSDATTAADEIHALALDAYRLLSRPDGRAALPGLLARLDAIDAAEAGWIEALGAAACGADQRRREAGDARLAAERRAEALQDAIDRANTIAAAQADELAGLDGRNRALQRALGEAEALVATQATELATLDGRNRDLQSALGEAEALVATQATELAALDDRNRDLQRALGAAEALVATQGAELAAADGRLRVADAALAELEALALEREQAIQALDRQVATTEAALRVAEGHLQQHVDRVAELERAKFAAEDLAFARMAEAGSLQAELDRREAVMVGLYARIAGLEATVGEANAQLERIRGSRLWPVYARLGRLEAGGQDG